MMTPEMKEKLRRYLWLDSRLTELSDAVRSLHEEMSPLTIERKAIIEELGRTGRTFRVDGVVLRANGMNEYAGLHVIVIEE